VPEDPVRVPCPAGAVPSYGIRRPGAEIVQPLCLAFFSASSAASSASFAASCRYGLSILWVLMRYLLHRSGLLHLKQFDSLTRRYQTVVRPNVAGKLN